MCLGKIAISNLYTPPPFQFRSFAVCFSDLKGFNSAKLFRDSMLCIDCSAVVARRSRPAFLRCPAAKSASTASSPKHRLSSLVGCHSLVLGINLPDVLQTRQFKLLQRRERFHFTTLFYHSFLRLTLMRNQNSRQYF